MTKQSHTPTPWRVTVHFDDEGLHLYENDGHGYGDEIRPTKAVAGLVQARVNAHAKLVAAAEQAEILLSQLAPPVGCSELTRNTCFSVLNNLRAVLAEVEEQS